MKPVSQSTSRRRSAWSSGPEVMRQFRKQRLVVVRDSGTRDRLSRQLAGLAALAWRSSWCNRGAQAEEVPARTQGSG